MSLSSDNNKKISLNIKPKLIIQIELIIIFSLLLLNILQQFLLYEGIQPKLITFIDMDSETNFPSFFSGINLLFTGLILLVITLSKDKSDRFYHHWLLISFIFFYLGMDEMAGIHERIGRLTSILLGMKDTMGAFLWILPFSILLLILVFFYLPFLLHLAPLYQRLLIISSSVFVMGGLVIESIGSVLMHVSVYYPLEYIAEETLEMLGVTLFIYTFLLYLKNEIGPLQFSLAIDQK